MIRNSNLAMSLVGRKVSRTGFYNPLMKLSPTLLTHCGCNHNHDYIRTLPSFQRPTSVFVHYPAFGRSKIVPVALALWTNQQVRCLWGWLNSIFNRVDESRIKEVGPDRACAEWLLRCGAGVRWDKGSDEWLRDYNSLPVGNYRSLKIVEIDATDSAVMHIGFPHFRGLKNVRKAVFHRCGYMEDEAVRLIGYMKDTLEELQVSSCGNVTDEGILTLVQMKNLKKLILFDFLEVRNRKNCLNVLQNALPNCDIYFPYAREADRDSSTQKNVDKT